MNFKALSRGELMASIGGILLGTSLCLDWYSLANRNAILGACHGPNTLCTGWQSLSAFRYLLLLAAVALAILAYIVIRGHALSWPRGELTAVTALLALAITLVLGLIIRPGSPAAEIGTSVGWWVSLAADLLILTGSIWRAQQGGARRKPPGVL